MFLIQIIVRNVISLFAGIFLTILGLRLAFKLLDVSATNSAVDFVYGASGRMIAPLHDILALPAISLRGNHVFDTAAFIGLLLYALAASLLLSMFTRLWRKRNPYSRI